MPSDPDGTGNPSDPGPDLRPRSRRGRRAIRVIAVVLVALIGAVIGASLAGRTTVQTEVGDVELSIRPASTGTVRVSLAPVGRIEAPALHTPVAITARFVALRDDFVLQASRDVVEGRAAVSDRQVAHAGEQIADGLGGLVVRVLIGATVGAGIAALVVFRSCRTMLVAAGIGLVAMGAFTVVTFAGAESSMEGSRVTGAIGLLPQADPALVEDAAGLREYAAKVFRNMEGLYTGYVRSAAADRIARTSDRVVAITADPADEEVRRQVTVLVTSQQAVGVLWLVPTGTAADATGDLAGMADDVPVLVVPAGAPASIGSLGPFIAFVLPGDGSSVPVDVARRAAGATFAVVPPATTRPTTAPPTGDVPIISTGDEPGAHGAGLTASSERPTITTGTATDDRLDAVILSFGQKRRTLEQAQLVTVADGDVSIQRVLR